MKSLKRYRVTTGRVAKRLSEALDAHEVKVFHDKTSGEIVYSKPLVAHHIRMKAVELAVSILEMKPPDRLDLRDTTPPERKLTDEELIARIEALRKETGL